MAETSTTSGGGIGFSGLLTILFIGLKLGHVIDWPWVWVLSPLWISFLLFLGILGIALTVLGVVALSESRRDKRLREARLRRIHRPYEGGH